ncbi:Putative ribonuclease H protein At1g65750 [Linum perenne]
MMPGARSSIRNGRDTPFWTARWVDLGIRLIDLMTGTGVDFNPLDTVADFVNEDGQWKFEDIAGLLPSDVAEAVIGMTPPIADGEDDQWVWGGEVNGRFSIKSTNRLLSSQPATLNPNFWVAVWRWKGPNRTRHFLWLAIQEKLLTNNERVKHHMATHATCEFCQHPIESVSHILRDCSFAMEVWNTVTLNSDGAVDVVRGKAAAGGLARDPMGRCLLDYSMNLGSCSITRAEIRGALEGLQHAWEAGHRNVLQLDSKTAISVLTKGETSNQFSLEIAHFRELRGRDWSLVVKHIYREGNRAADHLASIGYDYPVGSHSISISDCNLGYFLRYDSIKITEQRSILINN